MSAAPVPPKELARLRALLNLDVLDTPPEPEFDALVNAASLVCGMPISLLSLVDQDRQWFKAQVGLPDVAQTPRAIAFCAHAILADDLLEVPDAAQDPRFAASPLVLGPPGIRFYAGAPLRMQDGARVGTLCVIDRQTRRLTPAQRDILRHLADAAVHALESRRKARAYALSEARLRVLCQAAPLAVFATEPDGSFNFTNERWQQLHGLSQAQALGLEWRRTLHADDAAGPQAAWQRMAALRQDFDMAYRVRRDDGAVVQVRSVVRAVVGDDGAITGFIGSVEDMTRRKRQDEALRRSELLLRQTGTLAQVGGWELDLVTGELIWSDQTCRIQGVEPGHRPTLDEALGFYAPQARLAIETAVRRAMSDGSGWDLELPLIQAEGRRIWVRAVGQAECEGGKPVRLVGAIQDITDRVQQHQALEAARDRMTLATDSGGIGVWDYDLQTGELTWDAWMFRLYGVPQTPEAVAYDVWARHVHRDDLARAEHQLQQAIAGAYPFDCEFRVVWADGTLRHLRGTARVIRDASGQALRMVGVNWDVTALRTMSAELAAQHELLRVTLQSIGDAVVTTDTAGQVNWMSPVAERMTGWPAAEAVGRSLAQVFQVVNEDSREPAGNPVAVCLAHGSRVSLPSHTLLISRAGAEFSITTSAAPIRNEGGAILGVVLVFHDVTEQRQLSGEIRYQTTHDALTGLINRSEFENRLRGTLARSAVDRSQHALMVIDLDQFKLVNEACGHSVGDQLLQQAARLLTGNVRSRDSLARLGGDEFGVILEHCNSEQALRVAQQICERLDTFRFEHDGRRLRIGASIGLVPVDARWRNTAAVVQAADTACMAAKEAGRNRVHVWHDTDLALRARQDEMQWATRLEQAIDEDRFVLFAQRIEALHDPRAGLHAEVLLRLVDGDGRLIAPGAFLPAAERFHLASRIDRWVLRHAVERLTMAHDLGAVQTLCVNLSGQSIGDRTFHGQAIDLLTAAGADVCRRLCLEITETAAVTNLTDAAVFIEQVRTLGVRIALDDFGAGASSFGYLKTLKVDLLKIDGRFIRNLISDRLDDAAVRCFVDIARVMGIKTVAEFVDRPEVLQRLRELGVHYAQGFLLHRPEPIGNVLGGPGVP